MTTLPAFRPEAYRLSDRLADDTPISAIHTPAPNEANREELLLKKLGARGWGRMHHFRHYYQPGWGEARNRPLSPRAVEAFFQFLEAVKFPPGCVPSLFLTDQGGLELRWECDGADLQVEFSSAGIETYSSVDQRESTAPLQSAAELGRQLSTT